MKLFCDIYRCRGADTSNGGISATGSGVYLYVDEAAPNPVAADEIPAVVLLSKTVFGKEYVYAEPVVLAPADGTNYMAGGCFIFSRDSRFPGGVPIPLHDRVETWEQNAALSR